MDIVMTREEILRQLKAPYKEAKAYGRYTKELALTPPPWCIKQVELDTRQKITVGRKIHTFEVFDCLTFDPHEVRSVCDE